MKTVENIVVPTGNILIVEGEHGLLECLSIGDYGKEKNLKADFLGLKKDINGVPHGKLMPLEKKWVITISSQYGCSMGCNFCDVPTVGPGRNATVDDMVNQVLLALYLHPEVKHSDRVNVHFARMGEPTWNKNVLQATLKLDEMFKGMEWGWHPVVSTMMPKNNYNLYTFLEEWIKIKNWLLDGNAGLQISVNTTSSTQRKIAFGDCAQDLHTTGMILQEIIYTNGLRGRKIALNIALSEDRVCPDCLLEMFDPRHFLIKITPMHMTNACSDNGIKTDDGYTKYAPYKKLEEELKAVGFDVIVFIPSIEEDESRITCGNAILANRN